MALRLLPIAKPCTESFADMPGDDRTRFCDKCKKHVHDLSARTEVEARALFDTARSTKLCVRYAKDASGSIRFRAVAVAAAVSLTACSSAMPAAPEPVTAATEGDMGDGVLDTVDKCPDEPGSTDRTADDDGCPERERDPDKDPQPPDTQK